MAFETLCQVRENNPDDVMSQFELGFINTRDIITESLLHKTVGLELEKCIHLSGRNSLKLNKYIKGLVRYSVFEALTYKRPKRQKSWTLLYKILPLFFNQSLSGPFAKISLYVSYTSNRNFYNILHSD